eukprot:6487153-Amphidinium_carterae.2
MAVVMFSWAHTSKEAHQFTPKSYRMGQKYNIYVQGYHLELTASVLGLRPKDKDFHTLLNIVDTDWASLYKQHFMSDIARACNQQHTNSKWKRLPFLQK